MHNENIVKRPSKNKLEVHINTEKHKQNVKSGAKSE